MNTPNPVPDTPTPDDLTVLEALAHGQAGENPPPATLARLEKSGLLMRGWGRSYVLTRAGRRRLAERAAAV